MKSLLPEKPHVYNKSSLANLLLPEKQYAFLFEINNSLSSLDLCGGLKE